MTVSADAVTGDISIHALVKRATFFDVSFNASYVISIHALVKRATNVVNNYIKVAGISIHALVKRATVKIHLSSVK